MAKNKKNSKHKAKQRSSKQQRHLHSIPAPAGRPVALVQAERTFDQLTPDFTVWFEQTVGAAEGALESLQAAKLLANTCFELTGTCSATSFPPETIEQLVEVAQTAGPEELEFSDALIAAWHLYIDFLRETDRWTGPDDDLEDVHDLLAGNETIDARDFEVPPLTDAEAAEGFAQIPLIEYTTRLLNWLGTSKQVTTTGALRQKDIHAAAECVGANAHPVRPGKRKSGTLPGFAVPAEDAEVIVRSMHEVPILSEIWTALAEMEIVSVGSTSARPTDLAAQWLHEARSEQVRLYRQFVTEFLYLSIAESGGHLPWVFEDTVNTVQSGIVFAAITADPAPVEALTPPGNESFARPGVAAESVAQLVGDRLSQLVRLGLLNIGTHYTAPEVMVQCIIDLAALVDAENADDELFMDTYDPSPRKVTGDGQDRISQLRVELQDAEPAIWRRLLVPASTPLSELHHIIQRLFNWTDSHLHAFNTGSFAQGTIYQPAEEEDVRGHTTIDEATVALGEVLSSAGDKLTYMYDFGDDWTHVITFEEGLENDGGQYPRCTTGHGAAPIEDCGGVWGWSNLVSAANDPADEMHEEAREALGLPKGGSLNPMAFSSDRINLALNQLN